MSTTGRPRVLDDLKRRDVCTLIAVGCGMTETARYVGCSVSTVRREMAQNPDFKQKVRGAALSAQIEPLRAMRQAAATHWRAAAWMLERTNPRRFARPYLKSLQAEDIYAVVQEVIESAADEIQDENTRHRVCRRLLAAARNASRTLGIDDPTLGDPKSAVKSPVDDPALNQFLEDIERDHRRAFRSLRRNGQNSTGSATRSS
jgi:hypothetical protein